MLPLFYENIVNDALNHLDGNCLLDCAIGERTLAVESSRGIGIAMLYVDPLRIRGFEAKFEDEVRHMSLEALLDWYKDEDPLRVAWGLAAINSLLVADGIMPPPDFLGTLREGMRVGMVGCFTPLLSRIAACKAELLLFELKDLLDAFRPEDAPRLMPTCDVILLTGSAFSNRSIDFYLPHIALDAQVFIAGPSTPMADSLCDRFHIGSSRVTDKCKVFECIRQGGTCGDIQPWLEKIGRPAKRGMRLS